MPFVPISLILRYWKLFIPLGAIAFLVGGVRDIHLALAYPRPSTMTIDQFESASPNSGWYHVTGAYLDLSQSAALMDDDSRPGRKERAESCYIALHSANEAPGTPVHAFFRTTDPALMQAAQASAPIIGPIDSQGNRSVSAKPSVYRQLDLTGMIQTETSDPVLLRRRLDETADAVDGDAVILTAGLRPNIWPGMGMFAMGLIVSFGCVLIWVGDSNPFRGVSENTHHDDLPTQPGLGSIPYAPPAPSPYPISVGGYPPPYGQAPPPSQYASSYNPPIASHYVQAPPEPLDPPEPVKPAKTAAVPPLFDPFTD